jgi:hypothetical protein
MVTEKQMNFIYDLLEKLNATEDDYEVIIEDLNVQDASDLIEGLKFDLGWI